MRFTVYGASGFIGGALTRHLRAAGHEVHAPARDEVPSGPLGHVVYAIGLTGDFRTRPFDTVDAHVTALTARLRDASFDSWLYLSSTRVYQSSGEDVVDEDTPVRAAPTADGLYDLSKLLGEAVCLSHPDPRTRVARVANVYGPGAHEDSFLGMLLGDVAAGRDVVIGEAPDSAKDYVAVEDVCAMVEHVALGGRHRLYNLASGTAVTHREIAAVLESVTGRPVAFAPDGPTRVLPRVDVRRVREESGIDPDPLLDRLPEMLAPWRTR
ncbi:NAD-dependent epimerase/dehydratase family protein [Nocardioides stalactiti]|uniref:NAD-dependent epimerase/dehydratase family protein n=1 Tax=Nocardioides stalactiti TaxID=2755356 RepID=UPI001600B8F0|nr:NAD(P)-dependent oxidoreductase [Nocardioides stalactiti]